MLPPCGRRRAKRGGNDAAALRPQPRPGERGGSRCCCLPAPSRHKQQGECAVTYLPPECREKREQIRCLQGAALCRRRASRSEGERVAVAFRLLSRCEEQGQRCCPPAAAAPHAMQ